MRITDALRGEHAAMRPQLRAIRGTASGMSSVQVQANATLLTTILRAHYSVEEACLLRPLEKHRSVAEAIIAHKNVLVLLGTASRNGRSASLQRAAEDALANIEQEERAIFPVADRRLSTGQQTNLASRWLQLRGIKV